VGPTTSARLLSKWGDIDTLLENLGEVSMMKFRGATRVSRLLYEHKSSIALARSLTGLIYDDRLSNDLEISARQYPDQDQMINELVELGFEESHASRVAKRIHPPE